MSTEFESAGDISNPLCIKCGETCSETTEIDNVTVYIHTDCKTQVIFDTDQKEEVDA